MIFKNLLPSAVLICLLSLLLQAQEKGKIICVEGSGNNRTTFEKWLERDALYIITENEKETASTLKTEVEREQFVEDFWRRRDPNPGTEINEFRQEYYERIAYANEHFSFDTLGWKTDRGLVYILFGKPDKIVMGRADFEDLKNILFETWYYKHIDGVGSDYKYTFTDPIESNEFRLPKGERDEILNKSKSGLTICFMCPKI